MQRIAYPAVRRATTMYMKHGVTVPDPYQWLEDPDAEETKAFVTEQNKCFRGVVDGVPFRPAIKESIETTMNYPRTSPPARRADFAGGAGAAPWFYFYHNTGLQNQSVLRRSKEMNGEPTAAEVFFDPNALDSDGTTAISTTAWSPNDRYWAYALAEKGSDWNVIRVKDSTGADLPDKIDWVKFSGISWYKDVGFFYSRFPEPEGGNKEATASLENAFVCFHRIGTPAEQDVVVLRIPDRPKLLPAAEVGDCDSRLIFTIHDGCEPHNLVWHAKLPADLDASSAGLASLQVDKIVDEFVGSYDLLGNDGDRLFFKTTRDAPLGKLVEVPATPGGGVASKPLMDEDAEAKLDFVGLVGDTLLLVYLKDVKHIMFHRPLFAPGGAAGPATLSPVALPIGTVQSLNCRRRSTLVSLKMVSFLMPGRCFFFEIDAPGGIKVLRDDTVKGLNPDNFEVNQVFFKSPSGERKVPMFLCHRKGLKPTGDNPTLLYAYGGFNISVTPSFSPSRVVFMSKFDGIYAVANIRGGGEYGEKWHEEGMKTTKENCFVDFEAAARFLHSEKYSCPAKTAVMGGSNGGLLMGAVANRSPDLFGAVVCAVGVLDLFKFHQFTIGHAWKSDFGDPDVAEDFALLRRYSPLHNVRSNVQYPPMLVTTGDHDDRVVPLHSLKHIATLQHVNPEGTFLARVEVAAGHGAGMPVSKIVEETTDMFAFIARALDIAPKH